MSPILIILLTYFSLSRAQGTTILTSPRNFTFVPGRTPSPIQLTCDLTSVAAWIVNNNTLLLNRLGTIGHGVNGTNIVINNPMNNSEYICSDGINDGEQYYIFVAGVPAMVTNVDNNTICIIGNNVALTLNWTIPFNNLDPIVTYTVLCLGDVTCPPNFTTTDNTTRNYTITNLTPMTNYTFSVVATNSIGSGEAGVMMITTPPGQSSNIGIIYSEKETTCAYDLTVSWNNIDNVTQCNLSIDIAVSPTPSVALPDAVIIGNKGFHNITGLTPATLYTITITVVSIAGNETPSMTNVATVSLQDAVPQRIDKSAIMVDSRRDEISVQWPAANSPYCGNVLYYNITISSQDEPIITPNQQYTFTNLSCETEYNIIIAANNRAGQGSSTSISAMTSRCCNGFCCNFECWWLILLIIVLILILINAIVAVLLHCRYVKKEGPLDESKSRLVLLIILGVLTLNISNLIWYIYLKCQNNNKDKDKDKWSTLLFVGMIVSDILSVVLIALLWCLIYYMKKKDKSDRGDTPLTSPNPPTSPNQVKPKVDSKTFTKEVKKTEDTQQQQQQQQHYAVVDKTKKERPNQEQNTELNYVQPEFENRPGIRFKSLTDHTVQYGQFDDTT